MTEHGSKRAPLWSGAEDPGLWPRAREAALLFAAIGVTFLIVNYIHFQNFNVSVILYACVLDALIACVVVAPVYLYLRRAKPVLNRLEQVLTLKAAVLFILLYAVMGPTVIDRSLSIYIVEKVHQRGGAVAEAAMPALFVEEYMPEYRLVDVRLTEQLHSGTLKLKNGCLHLTPRGERLAEFMSFYRGAFLPKKRVLMGEVTDQLTRPFDNAPQRVDTTCPEEPAS